MARLARERRRLALLQELTREQLLRLAVLEQATEQPLAQRPTPPRKVPPQPVTVTGVALPRLTPGNGQMPTLPEEKPKLPEEKPLPAVQQVAQELGLLPSPPPSSGS